ncbi:MAG: hypothetical protein ACOYD7_04900 [Raoultibacter sp.]|jgi:hypothetical protein
MEEQRILKKAHIQFILAAAFTFGFITLLQFTPMPWFFLVLIAMHVGIALFIISKRSFRSIKLDVSRFYRTQYLLLLPYLLVMLYTFASRAGIIPVFEEAKSIFVLVYSACCMIVTICNYLCMKKNLESQLEENSGAAEITCN